jgi:hypothetical protein
MRRICRLSVVRRAAFMAVALTVVFVALVLAVCLSITPGGFGPTLKVCLLTPAVAIFVCVAILLSRVLPPRSPQIADIGLVILAMTVVELIAFVTAIVRLIRTTDLRTRRNAFFAALGGLTLVPAIGTYLIVVVVDLYAG